MNMFQSLLNSIPKYRSEMVEDLEIPEITLTPYVWTEPEDCISLKSDSLLSDSIGTECERGTISTDSSIPLSRAMTDSEIDYGFYKRFRSRGFSNPWDHIREAMEAFPPDYLTSLYSFTSTDTEEDIEQIEDNMYVAELAENRRRYNQELRRKMNRFFDEECCFFTPDDPGLLDLQDAIQSLDLKALEADLASIGPMP